MKYVLFILFVLPVLCLTSCDQKDSINNNCVEIQQAKIKVDKTSYLVGDDIHLSILHKPGTAYYSWTQSNQLNAISNSDEINISSAEKVHEGWYYVQISYPECATHFDSVYITVKNKAVNAPCSPANNTVTFSSIPDISPATVSWGFNNSWNRKLLGARGAYGYPDFNIYFNTYWDNKEPEDGEYSITDMSSTGQYPPYTVYISSLYSSIFFQASSGKVYVTHVNGKLRATFCDVPLSGSLGGPSYTTTASGTLTAP